ncbi:MAG: hypothetical protein EOP48_00420 [Sphingobacteriales bacterium]|nr:MAG: hypothetical protein EOP48_00420 [Sphingobacteriales bacterium]
MIAISIMRVLNVQEKYRTEIQEQYKKAVEGLGEIDRKGFEGTVFETYLDDLIKHFGDNENLLTDIPDKLDALKADFGMLPKFRNKKGVKTKSPRIAMKEAVFKALGLDTLRADFYPKYFSDIGIKTCVYCNSQLAVSVENENGKYSGRFDVDHYDSKDDYPWMAISLFNLYPTCSPCNRNKSATPVKFGLYSDDKAQLVGSKFVFKLNPASKASYLLSRDSDDIQYSLIDKDHPDKVSAFGTKFRIDAIYNTQKDLAEELLLKSQMYDDTYRKMLRENFSKLGISNVSIDRIILGNYVKEREIHKRPLSKFMQDIARELKLIV